MAKTNKSGLAVGGDPGAVLPAPAAPAAPQGIQSVSEAKDINDIRTFMQKRGVKVGHSLDNLDLGVAQTLIGEFNAMQDEFPQAAMHMKWIAGNEKNPSAFASAHFNDGIELNVSKMPDMATLDKRMRSNGRFHPANNAGVHVMTHEVGHLLERALIEKEVAGQPFARSIAGSYWNKCTMATKVIGEAAKIVKKLPAGKRKDGSTRSINELIGQISGYAKTNRSEALAEAVADYRANGANAQPLSIEVWKILKRELG